jgi:hypothetical protein
MPSEQRKDPIKKAAAQGSGKSSRPALNAPTRMAELLKSKPESSHDIISPEARPCY